MKAFFRNSDTHAEFLALLTMVMVLAIGALAKLDAATALFHLAH
jgi:hypothetical protein